jgi:MtfA peptidase
MTTLLGRLKAVFQPADRIDDLAWQRLARRVALVRRLPVAQQLRLREFCERFLRDKTISGAAGFEWRQDRALTLAALCCVPVLQLGYDWLRGWRELIIYPGQFRVRRHQHDEASGVVEEWDDDLAGEAWEHGPLVLSWADIRADLRQPQAGYNVVAHEIAHKLDALDGALDGTPPLPDAARRRAWVDSFEPAYQRLCDDIDAGREPPIDDYASEAPDEFFAVVSEYHYSAPAVLQQAMPAVARELEQFYGPSPFAAG